MPKREYARKYRPMWEKETWAAGWLTKVEERTQCKNNLNEAYCKVCFVTLRAHLTDLKKHSETALHKKNMYKYKPHHDQSTLKKHVLIEIKNEDKRKAVKLAFYISMHSAIRSIDHLSNLLKNLSDDFNQVRLHRTKCSAIIRRVISPCLFQNLLDDLKDRSFSLILDESTDISVTNYLCICIKYFSIKRENVVVDFLTILEVDSSTAKSLHAILIQFISSIGLDIKRMIGIGTDGASNLIGKNNSLYTLLKEDNSKLQLVRCVCHSLNNASSKASLELPASVDFLLKEIYNWFACSSQRRSEYKRLYCMLTGPDKKFHNFVHLSTTRWLARYSAVKTVLEHWSELATHFEIVVNKEKCYTARTLNEMLQDNNNLLYLTILKPILYEVDKVNILFQKNSVDIGRAYNDLLSLIMFLARKIMRNEFLNQNTEIILKNVCNDLAFVSPEQVDFGILFFQTVIKLKLPADKICNVQNKMFLYIKSLFKELVLRLPDNLKLFQNISFFAPDVCLNQITRKKFIDLPFLNIFVENESLDIVENQYNKLMDVKWNELLEPHHLTNGYLFWAQVFNFKNAGNVYVFREFAEFALSVLSLPSSNAVVERTFSIMNTVKTELRNKMQTELLCSILRIKVYSQIYEICCHNFEPTKEMYKCLNSDIYLSQQETCNDTEENEILEIFEEYPETPCIQIIE